MNGPFPMAMLNNQMVSENWAVHGANYGILAGKVGFLQPNRKVCDEQINTK